MPLSEEERKEQSTRQRLLRINEVPEELPAVDLPTGFNFRDIQNEQFTVATAVDPRLVPQVYKEFPSIEESFGPDIARGLNAAKLRANSGIEYANADLMKQDLFLTSVEEAYYMHGGSIPVDFFAQFEEQDIVALGFDAEATADLYNGYLWNSIREANTRDKASIEATRVDTLLRNFPDLDQSGAEAELAKIDFVQDTIDRQIGQVMAGSQASITEWLEENVPNLAVLRATNALTDLKDQERLIAETIEKQVEGDIGEELLQKGQDIIPGSGILDTAANTLTAGLPFLLDKFGGETSSRRLLAGEEDTLEGTLIKGVGEGFGLIGKGITAGVDGFSWLVNEGGELTYRLALGWEAAGDFDEKSKDFANKFAIGFDHLFGGTDIVQQRRAMEAELQRQSGRTDPEIMRAMGIGPVSDAWDILQNTSPEAHTQWMAMGGGDETTAFGMFAEDVTFHSDWTKALQEQADLWQQDVEQQIQKLSDENYQISDVILDTLSLWGEGVETVGVIATLGGKALFEQTPWIDGETLSDFWGEVGRTDTVGEALGLEGTLVGLGLDILVPALADPTTWIFGPRLAGRGRLGSINPNQALRAANSPIARLVHQQMVDIARGGAPNRGVLAAMEHYAATGRLGEALHVAGGHNSTLAPGQLRYLDDAPTAKVTRNINAEHALTSIPEGAVNASGIKRATERINTEGVTAKMVPEITYNPTTGRRSMTANADVAAALTAMGKDAVPVKVKIDPDFGVTEAAPTSEALKAKIAPDGTMDIVELDKIAQMDFQASTISKSDASRVGKMRETIQDGGPEAAVTTFAGDKTPIQVWLMPDDGRLVLADGNHRLAALKAEGFTGKLPVVIKVLDPADVPKFRNRLTRAADRNPSSKTPVIRKDLFDEVVDEKHVKTLDYSQVNPDRISSTGHVSPEGLLPDSARFGDVDFDRMAQMEFEHIMGGGDPASGMRTAVSIQSAMLFHKTVEKLGVGRWIDRNMVPINNNIQIGFTNANSASTINQISARLWGGVNDMANFDLYAGRTMRFWEQREAIRVAANELREQTLVIDRRLTALETKIADGRGALTLDTLRDSPNGTFQRASTRNAQRVRAAHALEDQRRALVKKQDAEFAKMNNYDGLTNILDEMYDDFNRQHIATNPKLKDLVDPKTGMVPWELLNGGRKSMTQMVEAVKKRMDKGISAEAALQREFGYIPKRLLDALNDNATVAALAGDADFLTTVMHNLGTATTYTQPTNPLMMMIAHKADTKGLRAGIRRSTRQGLIRGLDTAHQWWMIDKVMTPRTAAVVSVDELLRTWHTGGRESWFAWSEDKVAGLAESARLTRTNNRLSARWNRRLTALESYPNFYRANERAFLETRGVGIDDIEFRKNGNNNEYYEAANRTAGQQMNEAYLQNYFLGEEAFGEWFRTNPEASRLRTMDYFDMETGARRVNPPVELVFQGIQATVDNYFLGGIKAGKKAQALQLWKDATAESALRGATKAGPQALPKWVLEGFQSVTGNKRIPSANVAMKGVEFLSDNFFQGPVNYRRGMLAETVRTSEWARMNKLYEAQGVKIVTQREFDMLLQRNFPAASQSIRNMGRANVETLMRERYGVVSKRYLDEIVESKVVTEMEHQLYAFHMQSRVGRASRAAFPFGKPWADMWGFWGREAMSRPQLRGYLNRTNFSAMNNLAEGMVDLLPANPRTMALISRLAATDFDLDNIDEDPIFGAAARAIGVERLDVSPFLFLPVGGESPLMTMIPGLGILPMAAAHLAFEWQAPDPIEEPQEYRAYFQKFGAFLPGLAFSRPHGGSNLLSTLVAGGGNVKRLTDTVQALDLIVNPDRVPSRNALSGDWKVKTTYLRGIQQAMGDPATLEQLLQDFQELPTDASEIAIQALVDDLLRDLGSEFARANGLPLLVETIGEFAIPSRITAVDQARDLAEVWLDHLDRGIFPGLDASRFDLTTTEGRDQAARTIRSHFFDLPARERDILLVKNQGLAVNMISMWEKSELGLDILGATPYRSGGSAEDLDRQQNFEELGYIEPKDPVAFAIEILGFQMQSKQNVAADLYEEVLTSFNDFRWELVDAEDQTALQFILDRTAENDLGPWTTQKEVWENFPQALDQVVRWMTDGLEGSDELDPVDLEDLKDNLRSRLSVAAKHKAWGVSLPGDKSGIRDDLEFGFPLLDFLVTDEQRNMADALGIDLEPDQEFVQLYQDIANFRSDSYLDNPLFVEVMTEFNAIRSPRNAGRQAFETVMSTTIDNSSLKPETRTFYKQALLFLDDAQNLKARGREWLEMRAKGVERLGRMMQDDVLGKLDIKSLYDKAFGRNLGEFDWTPDEPSVLTEPNGDLNPNAQRVFIRKVVDGDTLFFSTTGSKAAIFGITGPDLPPEVFSTRLVGINARELAEDGGDEDRIRLRDRLQDAVEAGLPIYLVRDPERYGNTDFFGRQFSWLYIGEEAYYFPETMVP